MKIQFYKTIVAALFLVLFGISSAQAQFCRFVGSNFVVEDSKIRFYINRSRGGQIDYIHNKATNTEYLQGNGYYYLANGCTNTSYCPPDSFASNYYQSYDVNSNFRIVESTSQKCVVEVAGNLVRQSDGAALGVAYLRRYTYTKDSAAISVSHALRFDRTVLIGQLSATLDVDEDVNCRYYNWTPTEYWMGAARSWRRFTNGQNLSGEIGYPSGFTNFDNLGRMLVTSRAQLSGNRATIYSPGRGGITREFENPRNFQSITFWTNPRSANLHAKSLEAHFLNRDAKWVASGDDRPFRVSAGTVLYANEILRVTNN